VPAPPAAPPPPAASPRAPPALGVSPPAARPMASPQVALPDWSRVRIEGGARAVTVVREQADTLAALIARVGASEPGRPTAGPASLRITLAEGVRPLGVLELVDGAWRWTSEGVPSAARMLHPGAELSEALRREAERLLGR
jgi:hypothetical protein